MNRQELWSKAKDIASDVRYYFGFASDWVRAHPLTAGAIGFVLLGFIVGAYVFAAVTCRGEVPGTLTCTQDSTPTPPPSTEPPPPAYPYAACPSNTIIINGQWGNNAIETRDYGTFSTNILVVEVSVPANWDAASIKKSSWVEYVDGGAPREAVFSTKPCDFSDLNALKSGGWPARVFSNQPGFAYKRPGVSGSAYTLTPGTTYYINIRNRYPDGRVSCTSSCNMRGGLPK